LCVDLRMENPFTKIDYTKLGKTLAGRAWLEKALHPPGNAIGPIQGMPDNEAFPSTVMEFRNTFTVAPPVTATTTWNLLVCALPSAEVPLIAWSWNAGAAPPTTATQPTLSGNPNYNFSNWDSDVQRWRRLYGSLTCELNAPALSDQGMVYCAQQRLEIQDTVNTAPANPGAQAQMLAQAVLLTSLPTTPSVLQQISPGFYKHRAKEGCFTVSGLCQPTNLYTSGTSKSVTAGTEAQYGSNPQTSVTLNERSLAWIGGANNVQSGLSNNWSSSWVLFTGISISATVELKMIHAYELQAGLGSSFALFVEASAEPDTDAIDAYFALRHGMMDGYPASFNFFGSLMAGLTSLIPRIASWLAPVGKAALPAIGQAIGQLGTAAPVAAPRQPSPMPAPRPSLKTNDDMERMRRLESRLANLEVTRNPRSVSLPPVPAPRQSRTRSRTPAPAPRRRSRSVSRRNLS